MALLLLGPQDDSCMFLLQLNEMMQAQPLVPYAQPMLFAVIVERVTNGFRLLPNGHMLVSVFLIIALFCPTKNGI